MPRGTDNGFLAWHASVAAAALLLVAGGPLLAQAPLPTGCYDLHVDAWQPAVDLRSDSLYVALSPRIRLDRLGGGDPFERDARYRLSPAPGVIESVHAFAWWEEAGDSIRMVWTNGFSGVSISAMRVNENLIGTATTFWDFDRRTQTADVHAVQIACDAPVPEAWLPMHRFPASVLLSNGDSIRLGRGLPAGIETVQERQNTWHLTAPSLEAPMDVATDVQLAVDSSGNVMKIWVYFPPTLDFADLERQFRDLWGDPTEENEHAFPEGGAERLLLWTDRYVSLSLRRSEKRDGRSFIVAFLSGG